MSPRIRWGYLVPWAAATSLGYIWRSWRRLGYPTLDEPRRPPPRRRPSVDVITAAVGWATRYRPLRTSCIIRSLTLARLLRRHGYTAEVVVGVAPGARIDATDRFAHAWVELDGRRLGADGRHAADHAEFTRLR